MSGFEGHMAEYRQISIDRFDKNNLKSTVFFLSHCHRDHMVGLNHYSFLNCLKYRSDIFLYCSEVTKLLLLSEPEFKSLSSYIRVLEIGVTTTVILPAPEAEKFESVAVTALPAGHCPGSVMFLFEGKEGRALYTGDFRWEKNYATTLPALCVNGHMKEIDSMYVDTTFCVPEAFYIPSRDDCLSATASLVVAWLRESPQRFVHVSSRTKYGHEPLLAHLAKEAGTTVHTSREKQRVYDEITELRGVFTTNPTARIHACNWQANRDNESRLPCGYCPPKGSNKDKPTAPEVLVIRPSTMWFTNEPSRLQELVVRPTTGSLHRVCYSFHSSYSELRDLVSLLRPRRVLPNVLPASDTEWAQVKGRLEKFLTYRHKHHLAPAGDSTAAKPLGLLKRKRQRQPSVQSESDSDSLVFDSPEKPKRTRRHGSRDDNLPSSQKSAASSIISPTKSDTHSSYKGSDSEEDMFAHSDNDEQTPQEAERELTGVEGSQSLRSYVSGDEEMEEEDQVSSPQFRRFTSRDDIVDETNCPLNVTDGVHLKVDCGDDAETGNSKVDRGDDDAHSKPDCSDAVTSKVETGGDEDDNSKIGDDEDIGNSKVDCGDDDGNSVLGCGDTGNSKVDCGDDGVTRSKVVCDDDTRLKLNTADEVDVLTDRENGMEAIKSKRGANNCDRKTLSDCPLTSSGSSDRLNGTESNKTNNEQTMQDVSGENKSTSLTHGKNEIGDEDELIMEKSEEKNEITDGETDLTKPAERKKETDNETDHTKPAEENEKTNHKTDYNKPAEKSEKTDGETDLTKPAEKNKETNDETDHTEPAEKSEKAENETNHSKTAEKTDEREKTAENNTETNIISSDSDSDIDCQITKSFIKPRVNPWQRFPPPLTSPRNRFPPPSNSPRNRLPPLLRSPHGQCPVHSCGHGPHGGGMFVADGSIHKSSGHNSPRFKGQRPSPSSIIVRNSQCTTNLPRRKKLEGSIDLTDSETESLVDISEKKLSGGDVFSKKDKTGNKNCDLTAEDKNSCDLTEEDMDVDATKARESHRTEDDADVEDNDDDDLIADKTSSTRVAKTLKRTSPPEAPNEKDTQDDSNIILVDDIDTSTSANPNSRGKSPVKSVNTSVSSNSDSSVSPSDKHSSCQDKSSKHIETHSCCHSSDKHAACQDKCSVSSENDTTIKPSEKEDPTQGVAKNKSPSKDSSGVESPDQSCTRIESSSKGCSAIENASTASRCDAGIDNSTKHDPEMEHSSKSCSSIDSPTESQTCDSDEGCRGTSESVDAQKLSAGNPAPNAHTRVDSADCKKHSLSHSGDDVSDEPRPHKKQRRGKDSKERQEKEGEEEKLEKQQIEEKTEEDKQDKDQSNKEQTAETATDQDQTETGKSKNESDADDREKDTRKTKDTKRKSPKKKKMNNIETDDKSIDKNTDESEKQAKEPEESNSNELKQHEENTDTNETEEAKTKKIALNKDKKNEKETEKSKAETVTLNEEEIDKKEIEEAKTKKPTLNKNKMNSKEEKCENDEDSDTTVPPHSPDSTVPPDSPVAVHSSDSDSDADCKITKSFLRSPRRQHQTGCCPVHSTRRSPIRTVFHSPAKQQHCPSHGVQKSPVRNSVRSQHQTCPSRGVQKSPMRSLVQNSRNQHQTSNSQQSLMRGANHSPSSKTGGGPSCSLHPSVSSPHFQPGQGQSRSQNRRGLNPGSVSKGGAVKNLQQASVIDLTDDD